MKSAFAGVTLASAAIAAHAQSSVTVYGSMDAAITWAHQGAGTTTPGGGVAVPRAANSVTRLDSGSGVAGRLGFRGAEDLGGGLKAAFTLEGGIGADTGSFQQGGLPFGRQSWVGLSSTSGWNVILGRQNSPINLSVFASDALGGAFWGNAIANVGLGLYESLGSGAGGGAFTTVARVDNAVQVIYQWGPVLTKVMTSFGNETRGAGKLINPDITYEAGPLKVSASYARLTQPVEQLTATASPERLSEWMLGGSYDFRVARPFAGYFKFNGPKNRSSLATGFTASPFAYTWTSSRSVWAGVKVPLQPHVITAQVIRIRYDYPTLSTGDSTTFGAVYEYNLSKRTILYASYGRVTNNAFANANLYSSIVSIAPNGFGAKHSVFSSGIVHRF